MLKKLTNLSLKVKLIGGFGLVAFITLAVGLIGYHGVDMAGDQIESLGNDHLPGIENILRIKADFEAIIAVQTTLVNPLLTLGGTAKAIRLPGQGQGGLSAGL